MNNLPARPWRGLLCLVCIASLHAQSIPKGKVEGWIVTQRSTIDSSNGHPPVVGTSRVAGTADKLRMELSPLFLSPRVPDAEFIIRDLAKHTTMVVNTARQTFTVRPTDESERTMRIESISRSETFEDLGDGAMIAGYRTRHYLVHATLSARYSTADRSCDVKRRLMLEVWNTTDSGAVAILRAQASGIAPRPETKGGPPGVSLRTLRPPSRDGARNGAKVVTMTEVTEITRGAIDAGLFAAPASYRATPALPLSSGKLADSIMHMMADRAMSRLIDSVAPLRGETRNCTQKK
ncbi:MAG TPA: DUF4412 domain-containing protein [Thermoanaerobaculia bacterium]